MKKINNKGFAITTLLYGLMSMAFLMVSLLMGIMSQNRQNTSALVKKIEDELNRYGETESTFGYIGESQEYFIPYGQAGWYKIELWGARTKSKLGSYTSGVIYLKESEVLYFFLGKDDKKGVSVFNDSNTEVRLQNSAWNDIVSKDTTIMRAGGQDEDYISGYAGMNTFDINGNRTKNNVHQSGKFFINGIHIENVNDGIGRANVELLLQVDEPRPGEILKYPETDHNKLNDVKFIKYSSNGNTENEINHLIEIQAIDRKTGNNILLNKTDDFSTDGYKNIKDNYISYSLGEEKTFELDQPYDLSEIAIWNYYGGIRSYYSPILQVSSDGLNYRNITNTSETTSTIELKSGNHYSAWQPDPVSEIKSGNYYIIPANSDNIGLTATANANPLAGDKVNVSFEKLNGTKYQKWSIERIENIYATGITKDEVGEERFKELVGKPLYKIIDSKYKNALQVERAIGESGENVTAHKKYRGYLWDIWVIEPLNNNTFKIASVIDENLYLTINENGINVSSNAVIKNDLTIEQEKSDFTRRFKIINVGK